MSANGHDEYADDESNIDDIEEGSDIPSVKRIMESDKTKYIKPRFNVGYNPSRRNELTEKEKSQRNIIDETKLENQLIKNITNQRNSEKVDINAYKLK